jgi:hypothetical protein
VRRLDVSTGLFRVARDATKPRVGRLGKPERAFIGKLERVFGGAPVTFFPEVAVRSFQLEEFGN